MAREPRRHNRVNAEVPVKLDDGTRALTRDISPAGIYFIGHEKLAAGQAIHFTLEFDNPADPEGKLHLECTGQVVRVEDSGGKCGVAVSITESRIARRDPRERRAVPRMKEPDFS